MPARLALAAATGVAAAVLWSAWPSPSAPPPPAGAVALASAIAGLDAAEAARVGDGGAFAPGTDASTTLAAEGRLPEGQAYDGAVDGVAPEANVTPGGPTYDLRVRGRWARENCPGLAAAASARGLAARCDVILDPGARDGQAVVARFARKAGSNSSKAPEAASATGNAHRQDAVWMDDKPLP